MKKRYHIFMAALLLAVVSFAQSKETRQLSSFSSLSVSEAIDVDIRSGNTEEATVEVSGAELDDVITEIRGNRLLIHMKENKRGWRNVNVSISLTYKQLNEIKVSSAASVSSNDAVKGERLELNISSAADAYLEIDVENLEATVSSAGDLELKGRARRQDIRISSSGDYDGYDLESEEARIDASSAGDARVFVTKEINADAQSAGSVYYRGNPAKVYVDSSSGGKVRKS